MPVSDASRPDDVQAWLARGDNLSEWHRLRQALALADGFTFLAVKAEDVAAEHMLAQLVTEEAASRGIAVRGFDLGNASTDRHVVTHVQDEIAQSPTPRWFYFFGGPQASARAAELGRAWLLLNQKREVISEQAAAPFILALHPQDWLTFRRNAPDFWSIYQASFRFGPARALTAAHADSPAPEPLAHVRPPPIETSSSPSGWRLDPARAEFSAGNFVGRRSMERFLLASLRESGARILVTGTGGMGKSVLVRHVVAQLFGHYADGIWWVPMQELPGSAQERVGEALGRLIGDLLPRTQPPAALDERARLFRAVTDGRQMLFVFDDIDDEGVLGHVIPGDSASVIAISRMVPSTNKHRFNVVTLQPLSAEETRQFLQRLAPEMSESVVSTALSASNGSPLLANLLGSYLREFPDQADDVISALIQPDRSEAIHGFVDRVLQRLAPDAAALWPALGLLNPVFTVGEAVAESEMEGAQVSAALKALTQVGLVAEVSDGQFSLAHALLREAALARLGTSDAPARYLIHALEQGRVSGLNADSVASLLARYRGGNSSQQMLRDAILQLIYRTHQSPDTPQAAQFAHSLAEAAARHGDAETERVAIRQLPALLSRLERFDEMAEAAARWITLAEHEAADELSTAYLAAAGAARLGAQFQKAVDYAVRAREHAITMGDRGQEVMALIELSLDHVSLGKLDQAFQEVDEAVRLAEADGDRYLRSRALSLRGIVASLVGHSEQAIESYSEALRLSREIQDVASEQVNLLRLGRAQERRADFDEAVQTYSQALQLGRVQGDQRAVADALEALAGVEHKRGDLRASASHFGSAIDSYDQLGLAEEARGALLRRSVAAAGSGDVAVALDTMDKLVPRVTPDASGRTSEEAIAFLKALIGTLHGNPELRQQLRHAHLMMVAMLLQRDGRERAEAYITEMQEVLAKDFGDGFAGILRDLIEDHSNA